jgi:hypothetical protein
MNRRKLPLGKAFPIDPGFFNRDRNPFIKESSFSDSEEEKMEFHASGEASLILEFGFQRAAGWNTLHTLYTVSQYS